MADLTTYKYDAFISYRHSDMDSFVAKTLHKKLEAFKPPRKLDAALVNGERRIKRVFRDEEELPLATNLEDPIVAALSNTDWLIVICSPRLNQSEWCKKEISTFIEQHGRDRVLLVLAEGEPNESFPELMKYKEERIDNFDGTFSVKRTELDPLAADFRGNSKKEISKKMDTEIFRLLARMYNVNFDDLRRRHHEQEVKKRIGISALVAAVGLLFGAVGVGSAIYINGQNTIINNKNEEIAAQNETLEEQKQTLEEQQQILVENQAISLAELATIQSRDNPREALKTAYASATEYDGIPLVYTPESQHILSNLLHLYDSGATYKLDDVFIADSAIDTVINSKNNLYSAYLTQGKRCFIFNNQTGIFMDEIRDIENDYECAFYGDEYFIYLKSANSSYLDTAVVCNLSDGSTTEISIEGLMIGTNESGNQFYTFDSNQVTIFDINSLSQIKTVNLTQYSDSILFNRTMVVGDYIVFADGYYGTGLEHIPSNVYVVSQTTEEIMYKETFDVFTLFDAFVYENCLYIAVSSDGVAGYGYQILALAPSSASATVSSENPDAEDTEAAEDTEDAEVAEGDADEAEEIDEETEENSEETTTEELPTNTNYPLGTLWKIDDSSRNINELKHYDDIASDKIFIISKASVVVRDIHDGSILKSTYFNSNIVGFKPSDTVGIVFEEDGCADSFPYDLGLDSFPIAWFSTDLDKPSQSVTLINGCGFVTTKQSGKIYIFRLTTSNKLESIDTIPDSAEFYHIAEYYTHFSPEINDICSQYAGINTSDLHELCLSADGSLMIADYNSGAVDLYDVQTKELLTSIDNETGFWLTSCGQNKDYYFIGSYDTATYIIDKESKTVVAEVDHLTAYDDDFLYISDDYFNPEWDDYNELGDCYRIGFYTPDEVLDLAKTKAEG